MDVRRVGSNQVSFQKTGAGTFVGRTVGDARFHFPLSGGVPAPLTPSVSVNAGDLIGVAMFGDVNCGVGAAQDLGNQTFLAIPGDFTGGSTASASVRSGALLSLRASSSDVVLVGVIPAVGSVQGCALDDLDWHGLERR